MVQAISDKEPDEVPVEALDTVADQLPNSPRASGGTKPETGGLEGLRVVAVMEAAIAAVARASQSKSKRLDRGSGLRLRLETNPLTSFRRGS